MNRPKIIGVVLLSLGAFQACWAEWKREKVKTVLRVKGDFCSLARCAVNGNYDVSDARLMAKEAVRLGFDYGAGTPCVVEALVKLPPRTGEAGSIALRAGNGKYELKVWHNRHHIYIRCTAESLNLWANSTFKYREGRGSGTLRYSLRLDRKLLEKKLARIQSVLKRRKSGKSGDPDIGGSSSSRGNSSD